jgi:hypothetical protein
VDLVVIAATAIAAVCFITAILAEQRSLRLQRENDLLRRQLRRTIKKPHDQFAPEIRS